MMQQMNNRNHKIKADYGITDYYRFFKRNNPDINITSKAFGELLREYNGFVRDSLSYRGTSYNMPSNTGIIEIRKSKAEVTINEDGTIRNSLPVNWQETRKLWNENPEAREKKIKIKFVNLHSNGYTFKFLYLRTKANYKHKKIYRLKFNRQLKRQLSQSIFNNTIDAFVKQY